MKGKLYVLAPAMLLAACATTSQAPSYEWIDLTQNAAADTEYWVVEHRQEPLYPPSAARDRQSGCVEMTFFISPTGQAQQVEVVRSFPGSVFDASAKKALAQWRWAPTAENASNQAVKTTVKLDYAVGDTRNLGAVQEACDLDLREMFG